MKLPTATDVSRYGNSRVSLRQLTCSPYGNSRVAPYGNSRAGSHVSCRLSLDIQQGLLSRD
jgi:hypothetical protein